MKKTFLLALSAFLALSLSAETMPTGYYDAINGKKDAELKTALSNIIKGGERLPYNTAYHSTTNVDPVTGDTIWKKGDFKPCTWLGFVTTDKRSDGTVWDMYSNTKRYFPVLGGSAAGLDIEHGFPKSWWGGDNNDAYKDLYHLCPADRIANNNKSAYPPGILADSAKVNNGLFFMGKDNTWNTFAFDVCDEYKGDFARAYFYIATAYEDFTWIDGCKNYINKDSYLGFTPHMVEILLAWHRKDPVSEKEVDRLDAVSTIQHNRNAFIEYPELVEYIWGEKKGQTVDLATLKCTTDGTYEFPVSSTNPLAHPAKEITENGFLASWSNTGSTEYVLNVFTREFTGKNDTLVALVGLKKTLIDANSRLTWLQQDGVTEGGYNNMDGSYASCTYNASKKAYFQLRLSNFGEAPENTKLDVKCCVFKSDQTADLVIKGDDDVVLYEQPLVLDEMKYTFAIPKGTKRVSIWQKEGDKPESHRVSLQQAFLYAGDYKETETSLEGYPVKVSGIEYKVITPMSDGTKLYYRVTPDGLRATNTIEVSYNDTPTAIQPVCNRPEETQKIIEKGQVIIIRDGVRYSVLGIKLN